MNRQSAIALTVAVLIGLVAVYLANAFFSGVQQRQEDVVRKTHLSRIVVAAQPIDFAAPLTNTNVVLADWPAASVPVGAFTSLAEATRSRVALQPIAAGEPILATRVSGTDGRASLSVNLPRDKVAVAIPINDVSGVGGFVRPGDLVDVLLTRQIPGAGTTPSDKMTDVVLQAVPVLAIDQVADKAKTDPALAKTATLQVDGLGAQKLALARELGSFTLALRNIASPVQDFASTVTPRDLGGSGLRIARGPAPAMAMAPRVSGPIAPAMVAAAVRLPGLPRIGTPGAGPGGGSPSLAPRHTGPVMVVYRKGQPTEYEVSHVY